MKKLFFVILTTLFGLVGYSQVVLYTGCEFNGSSSSLVAGSYTNAAQFKLPDNTVSSVKIPDGYTVELFENPNFTGRKIELSENVNCLPAIMKEKVSSVKISKKSTEIANNGKISIYSNCSFRGKVSHWPPVDYTDLQKTLNNSRPLSIQIPKGLVVELYDQLNFKGNLLGKYTSNQDCLSRTIRNSARSMKVYMQTEPEIPVQPR